MSTALLVFYFAVLGVLALIGVHRLVLAVGAASANSPAESEVEPKSWPTVVLQLPLYNEAQVVERLLRSAGQLDYPQDKLLIQVLDDSNDGTRAVVDRGAKVLTEAGWQVDVVRRSDRTGFKAGALAAGLLTTDAEFVAIFDADFIIPTDFLRRAIKPLIENADVGMVQARWAHLNRDHSWLTRAQAVFLDGHFAVEHLARARFGHFFNFNGTAGVWRRQAIEDAGGWRDLTITEDLDLSYRAQLAGWRFVYLDALQAPAELPESWSAFRSQQARWVRGSVETSRLLLKDTLRAKLAWGTRVDAFVHLTQNFAYLFMALLALVLPAAVILRDQLGWRIPGGQLLLSVLDYSMLTAGTCAMIVFYWVATRRRAGSYLQRFGEILLALCVGAGMSFANAIEVLKGLGSEKSVFVRTPKRGGGTGSRYERRAPWTSVWAEILFVLYFSGGLVYAVTFQLWAALPFLLLYWLGFVLVAGGISREGVASWSYERATAAQPRP